MVTLTSPKPTSAEEKELKIHQQKLKQIIEDMDGDYQQVADLRKREASLEKRAAALHRRAATFELEAERDLQASLKQIERVHDAIRNAEEIASHRKGNYFQVIDQAQECVRRLGQAIYNQLLDDIAAALAPYYTNFNDARFAGRAAPAVNDLVRRLLATSIAQFDSIEKISFEAKDVLRKVEALLTGSEIWSYGTTQAP